MDPVAEQLAAYNSGDLERFLACYASDVLIEDGRGEPLLRGREVMRRRYQELFEASPELHCELVHRTRIGSYVIDEERVSGMGHQPPGCVVQAVAIYRVEDGRIAHVRFLR